MSFLTSTILSGVLYDVLKKGTIITANFLKDSLKNWIIDDDTAELLSGKIMDLNSDLSQLRKESIQEALESSPEILEIISRIQPSNTANTYINTHSGTGDIVNGNKIINQK
ncbi:GapS6a family protein [Aeromonas salmonicida]